MNASEALEEIEYAERLSITSIMRNPLSFLFAILAFCSIATAATITDTGTGTTMQSLLGVNFITEGFIALALTVAICVAITRDTRKAMILIFPINMLIGAVGFPLGIFIYILWIPSGIALFKDSPITNKLTQIGGWATVAGIAKAEFRERTGIDWKGAGRTAQTWRTQGIAQGQKATSLAGAARASLKAQETTPGIFELLTKEEARKATHGRGMLERGYATRLSGVKQAMNKTGAYVTNVMGHAPIKFDMNKATTDYAKESAIRAQSAANTAYAKAVNMNQQARRKITGYWNKAGKFVRTR